jgi:methyl-accepting chemotaxis protein
MAGSKNIEIIIEGDNQTGKAFKSVDKSLGKLEKSTDKAAKSFGAMDVAIGTVVGNIVTGIGSAAIGAIANLASDVIGLSREFEDSSRKIQASLGTTAAETDELSESVEELFSDGFDVSSATDAIVSIRQNMGDLADDELENVATGVLNISNIFGQDLAKTSNAAGALMKQFGLDSQQSMDFIAAGFRDGLNTSDDFLDSIGEYSNQFASLGFTADEFFSIMETGLQAGVLGTDKIADAIGEFGKRMLDGSDTTRDALSDLFAEVGEGNPSLDRLNDELDQAQSNFNIAGKKVEYWEGQLEKSKDEADRLSAAIDETKRSLDRLSEPKLKGMEEFDNKLFNLEMKAKKLRLAMIDMDEDSPEFKRTKAALEDVNTEMDRLNLQRDIKFEPQFRALADAADYANEPVLTFGQAMAQIGQQQANLAGLQTEFTNVSTEIGVNQQKLAEWQATLAQSEVDIGNIQDAMAGMTGPAQEMLQAISDGSMTVADSLPQVLGMLRQIEDPIEQNRIGVALFGTQWEDMTAQAMLAIDTTSTGMDDMAGSMDKINETAANMARDQQAAYNQILVALKPLADAFNAFITSEVLPLVKEYAPLLAEWLGENLPVAIEYLKTNLAPLIDEYMPQIAVLFGETAPNAISSMQLAIEFLTPAIDTAKMAFDAVKSAIDFVVEIVDLAISLIVNLSAVLQGVIDPATAAKNIFGDLIDPLGDLLDMIAGVTKAVVNLGSSLLNLKPPKWLSEIGGKTKNKVKGLLGFAEGGTYPANEPFVVGERGPEVIVPNGSSGTVVPNDKIGGGGKTINAPITINISGSADEATVIAMEKRIHATLDRLIQGGAF